ncbi:MAG TPA: tRNA lysidine(34) synthetase TilS [Actinomycetota bacterium]|nr:tRNA lysidine(34) synthetase TilS [Actinomycetota bacterium]
MAPRALGDSSLGGPGFDVVERVRATIARNGMFSAGDRVVVGFSGGPDSTCLLDVLARLQKTLSVEVVVAHVDHRLSADSSEISARVSRDAAAAGFEVHLARAPDLAGANLHARARDFRYEFFDIVARKESAARIATGHTLDDRVETTLARFIHGAGTDVLAGIRPVHRMLVRPLIDLTRRETRAYCLECELPFVDDAGNHDPRFERSFVRDELVARIEDRFGDGALRAMAMSVARLREDSDALTDLARRLYPGLATGEEGSLSFPRDALEAVPRAVRRRLLELAIGHVRDRQAGIDEVLDAFDAGAPTDKAEASFDVAGGRVRLTRDRVEVEAGGE